MACELFLTMYLDIFVYPEAFFLLPIFIFIFMNLMLSIDSQNEKFIVMSKKTPTSTLLMVTSIARWGMNLTKITQKTIDIAINIGEILI